MHIAIAHLNREVAFDDVEKVVGVIMFMPIKFPLDFNHHEVVTVVVANDFWLPMILNERKLLFEIDCGCLSHEEVLMRGNMWMYQSRRFAMNGKFRRVDTRRGSTDNVAMGRRVEMPAAELRVGTPSGIRPTRAARAAMR
jgi:hypothetical protein